MIATPSRLTTYEGDLMRHVHVVAVCVGVTLIAPIAAWAWGEDGHRVVCELAYLELAPRAKERVDKLRGANTDDRIESVGDLCVWADFREPKTDDDQLSRRDEHYVNVPRWYEHIYYEECPDLDRVWASDEFPPRQIQRVCLFSAIRRDASALVHPYAGERKRLRALMYLGHWVGDIHQPLHVSFADDLGGNAVLLRNPLGQTTKLHSVWDSAIPIYMMKKVGLSKKKDDTPRDRSNAAKYAAILHERIEDADRATWAATPIVMWANESYDLARERSVDYCTLVDKTCQYTSDEYEFDKEDDTSRRARVTEGYVSSHGPTIERRLQQAGVRLGSMLNSLLDN
jgi:hypothetical protein